MITLKNIFNDLAMGVLDNTVMVDPAIFSLHEKYYPKVISYLNLALTALHRRFYLRAGQIVVQQHPDLTKYPLRIKYAASNTASTEPIKFIIDTPENPFLGDLLKVEQVFSEIGEEYIINDTSQAYPIYTPQFDVLSMLPSEVNPQAVFVVYRADYPKIILTPTFNAATYEVDVPGFILDALYSRVAAYAYRTMNADDTEVSPSRSYMYQYELECKRIEEEGLVMNDNNIHNMFEANGWV